MQEEHPEQIAWPQETVPSQAVVTGMQTPATSSKPEGPITQKPSLPKPPNPARKYASHPSAFHAASQKPPPPVQSTSTTRDCDTEPSETPNEATERYQKDVYRGRCLLFIWFPCTLHTERAAFLLNNCKLLRRQIALRVDRAEVVEGYTPSWS